MKYYFNAFKNYANCYGRASRKEFWWFILFHYAITFTLAFLDGILGFYSTYIPIDYGYMTLIYLFASACPKICLQVRRLHDVGVSGTWWWVVHVPIVSWYVIYLNCKPSEPNVNVYGIPPYNERKWNNTLSCVKYCRKCGWKLKNGSNFCSQCGTEIINTWR